MIDPLRLPQSFIILDALAAVWNPEGRGVALHGSVVRNVILIAVFDGSGGNEYLVSLKQIAFSPFQRADTHIIDSLNRIVALLKNLVNTAVSL